MFSLCYHQFSDMIFNYVKGQTKQTKKCMSVLLKIIGIEKDRDGNKPSVENW